MIKRNQTHPKHRERRTIWILTLGCLLVAACGGKGGGGDNGNNNNCPEGLRPEGPACVPIFDDCPGPAEIPILGGGCEPVGVTECATTFVSDGQGGCEPVLDDCPNPAEIPLLGGGCQRVGVTGCAAGFVSDGEGGCDAILPDTPCDATAMEVLGHSDCQPIGDCGTGTWGNITTDATTVFVDQTADATGADGSDASPFVTIADALAAVEPGGQIAVAAGEYLERLVINERMHLAGRCAELVTIRGRMHLGQPSAPIIIHAGGSGTLVTGVTLTGDAEGVVINGAQGVIVEEARVSDTGWYGVFLDNEASGILRRTLVVGCTNVGVFSVGSALELFETVVRNTDPPSGETSGWGISAQCDPQSHVCGNLNVTASVISGNMELGIAIFGTETVISSSVVRDTGLSGSGASAGINAQCLDGVQDCGSLMVENSVVRGNREKGIDAVGVEAEVNSTVVRETSSGTRGLDFGISSGCQEEPAQCRPFRVADSVVSNNDGIGIMVFGTPAHIGTTIVKHHPEGGIRGQCDEFTNTCSELRISRTLVAENFTMGVLSGGLPASIEYSVVRDTLTTQTHIDTMGIYAECARFMGECGRMNISRSLVLANRNFGITSAGADVTVASSVVRGTLEREIDGKLGRGIYTGCDTQLGICGTLTVSKSLVEGNRDVGIMAASTDATVISTVVRDTLGRDIDGNGGAGISAQCDPDQDTCGSMTVSESLIERNRDCGIFLGGMTLSVSSTLIRDTVADSEGKFGRGIVAQCIPEANACGGLAVENTLVDSNQNVGIFIAGVPAQLHGVAVLETRPNDSGVWTDEDGHGVWALCYPGMNACAPLVMTASVIRSGCTAGLAVEGVSGLIESSAISSIVPQPSDGAFGYGIQIGGPPLGDLPSFDVRFCWIEDAALSGILYSSAGGTLSRSVVGGGQFSVVMNVGSSPTIADDNVLSGTAENEPTWADMDPSPSPAPSLPLERDRPQ